MPRWVHALGALQLALVLLPALALALFLGALMESWYARSVAQDLVYGAWWFALLLVLLGVNIVFAALKKWPWKRQQTGFLITHLGLITLVGGGLVSSLTGLTGTMALVDSASPQAARWGPHQANEIVDGQALVLRVARIDRGASAFFEAPFAPGPAAWQPADEALVPDGLTRALLWLAHPGQRSWRRELAADASLTVLDFQPHTRWEVITPATRETPGAFPALAFELSSPATGPLPPQWLAAAPGGERIEWGPGVVAWAGSRLSAEKLAAFLAEKSCPRDEPRPWLGVLEFATNEADELFFRAFAAADPHATGLQRVAAERCTERGPPVLVWPAMNWRLRVTRYEPYALDEPTVLPVARTLGQSAAELAPAVKVRLTHGGESRELWLNVQHGYRPLTLGGERFSLGLFARSYELPFSLTLTGAEQTTDRGSRLPATQASEVLLHEGADSDSARPQTISLNAPLVHHGYRVYQAGYEALGGDTPGGRPLHRAVLRVTLDPGLRLKYIGSLLVAAGIACMFTMRAYRLPLPWQA